MRIARYNAKGRKLCAQPLCPIEIGARFLMCLDHWNAVPRSLRLRIWAALDHWKNDPSDARKLHALQQLQAEAIALVS